VATESPDRTVGSSRASDEGFEARSAGPARRARIASPSHDLALRPARDAPGARARVALYASPRSHGRGTSGRGHRGRAPGRHLDRGSGDRRSRARSSAGCMPGVLPCHWSRSRGALSETRDFLRHVRTSPAVADEHRRYLAVLHAVDHLDRLDEALRDRRSTRNGRSGAGRYRAPPSPRCLLTTYARRDPRS
jgi:hypothetical protein